MSLSQDSLKRKLRQLKRLEFAIRFKDRPAPENPCLVWDSYFSTKRPDAPDIKYPLARLSRLDEAGRQRAFEDYCASVYFQYFTENGLTTMGLLDPQLLALLGLPAYASPADIKKRYRELAKRYHPDHGGSKDKFIELLNAYEALMHD